jgi:cobalt-precorrin-5B (C1)-methyltransferase
MLPLNGVALGDEVARAAQRTAARVIEGRGIDIEVVVFDRDGALVGRAPFGNARDPHAPLHP